MWAPASRLSPKIYPNPVRPTSAPNVAQTSAEHCRPFAVARQPHRLWTSAFVWYIAVARISDAATDNTNKSLAHCTPIANLKKYLSNHAFVSVNTIFLFLFRSVEQTQKQTQKQNWLIHLPKVSKASGMKTSPYSTTVDAWCLSIAARMKTVAGTSIRAMMISQAIIRYSFRCNSTNQFIHKVLYVDNKTKNSPEYRRSRAEYAKWKTLQKSLFAPAILKQWNKMFVKSEAIAI